MQEVNAGRMLERNVGRVLEVMPEVPEEMPIKPSDTSGISSKCPPFFTFPIDAILFKKFLFIFLLIIFKKIRTENII